MSPQNCNCQMSSPCPLPRTDVSKQEKCNGEGNSHRACCAGDQSFIDMQISLPEHSRMRVFKDNLVGRSLGSGEC
uniref:Macaca fascicularis brain cDNA, clone: QflA-19334 n=1 Tax=Macaca fascicularis TaxID=9541 RepID=I7GCI1_MACFA|nr:unnamed protein product [Macaca fascicularis]